MGRAPAPDGDQILWLLNGVIWDLAKIRAIAEQSAGKPPNLVALLDTLGTIEGLAARAQADAQKAEEIRKLYSGRSRAARLREQRKREEQNE